MFHSARDDGAAGSSRPSSLLEGREDGYLDWSEETAEWSSSSVDLSAASGGVKVSQWWPASTNSRWYSFLTPIS